MNKLAVFVEGYTEVVFIEKLVEEIVGTHNVLIQRREIRGGTNVKRTNSLVKAENTNTGQKYFVLIVDCGNDELVKTRILEEHESLTRQKYQKIMGIRDVRPAVTHAEIPMLERGLRLYVKTSLAPVEFILAIMEVEAWFLGEATHFPRIDPAITVPAIIATLGFNPETDDLEKRPTPCQDLINCYAIGGKTYEKRDSQMTVNALDFALVYLDLWRRFSYLRQLVQSLEQFLGSS